MENKGLDALEKNPKWLLTHKVSHTTKRQKKKSKLTIIRDTLKYQH